MRVELWYHDPPQLLSKPVPNPCLVFVVFWGGGLFCKTKNLYHDKMSPSPISGSGINNFHIVLFYKLPVVHEQLFFQAGNMFAQFQQSACLLLRKKIRSKLLNKANSRRLHFSCIFSTFTSCMASYAFELTQILETSRCCHLSAHGFLHSFELCHLTGKLQTESFWVHLKKATIDQL